MRRAIGVPAVVAMLLVWLAIADSEEPRRYLLELAEINPAFSHAQCVVVKGVPKSGTTWLTSMLEELRNLNCKKSDEAKFSDTCNDRCVDVYTAKHKATVSSAIKTDALPIFIFRDTRDVLVSHFHWATHDHKNVAEFARDDKYGIKHVVREQNMMLGVAAKLKESHKPTYVLYYEDLSADPVAEARNLANYMGMKLAPANLKIAVERSSFDAMRKKEKQGELHLKIHPESPGTLLRAEKEKIDPAQLFGVMTRKGVVGGWRDEIDVDTRVYVEGVMKKRLDPSLLKRFVK